MGSQVLWGCTHSDLGVGVSLAGGTLVLPGSRYRWGLGTVLVGTVTYNG